MKKNKKFGHILSQKDMLRILVTLLSSILISICLIIVGNRCAAIKPWLSIIVDVVPEWYMNTYYESFQKQNGEPFEDVVLLDLDDTATREDIANVINLVALNNPKVIGVDYTFSNSTNYDSAKTAYLIRTIDSLPEQIPIVFAYDNTPSAIPDSVVGKHHVGHVDFYGYYDFKLHSEGKPHMAYTMAELAGLNTSKFDSSSFVVNYHTRESSGYPIYCPMTLEDSTYIEAVAPNRIILIGSTNDGNDFKRLPFRLNGKEEYIAGSRIIIATLISILSTNASKESPLNSTKFHYFSKLPRWRNWCIIVIYALMYLFLYCILDRGLTSLRKKSKWWTIPIGLIKSIVSVGFIGLLLVLSMLYYTNYKHFIPDTALFLYMTAFMSYFYELFDYEKLLREK